METHAKIPLTNIKDQELNIEDYIDFNYLSFDKINELAKKITLRKENERKNERKLINYISDNLQSIENPDTNTENQPQSSNLIIKLPTSKLKRKHTNQCGSLYDLINSEYFNIHYLMNHLDKKWNT